MTHDERLRATAARIAAPRAALAALLAVAMGAVAGVHATPVQAGVDIDVDVAPPAARVVVAPPPRAGFVWAPGYWHWNGRAHVWHDGYWVHERAGFHYVPDAWVARGPHYHYVRGHWER